MGLLSDDTDSRAEEVQFALLQRMPPAKKLALLSQAVLAGHRLKGKTMDDPLLILTRVTEVLERLEIDYLVGGSVSSTIHGEPRFTQDADLVVRLRDEDVEAVAQALEGDFYLD